MVGVRTRTGLLALALTASAALSSCVGNPGPPTTTAPPGEPAAGCYDTTADGTADYAYTGVPNVAGNMLYHNSSDGSCSGATIPEYDSTLILATNQATAVGICTELGGTGLGDNWAAAGWLGMPANAYRCIIPLPMP